MGNREARFLPYAQCFDTSHGHSHGGGNDPYLGAKALARAVRGAMKAANPEAVITGENPSETAIDLLDGFLYRNTVWPDMAPLFATVYGDYIIRHGIDLSLHSDGFYVQCAALFTEGAMLGRLSLDGDETLKGLKPGAKEAAKMEFLKKLADYRRPEVGGNYLIYGQLLRPLKLSSGSPTQPVTYREPRYHAYKDGMISLPALPSGVFKAVDGSLGIFLVNVTNNPQPFNLKLKPEDYPLSTTAVYDVAQIDPLGKRTVKAKSVKAPIAFGGIVPGHEIVMYAIQKAP